MLLTSFTGRLVLKTEGGEKSGTLPMELSDFESELSMVFFLGFAQLFLFIGGGLATSIISSRTAA